MPQECNQIADSDLVIELKTLDLSCNPIGVNGLCNLFHLKKSKLMKLENLELFNCDIKAHVSKRLPAKLKKQENLQRLNLSYNDLDDLLDYISGPAELF